MYFSEKFKASGFVRVEIRGRRTEKQLYGTRSAGKRREPESADHRHRLYVFPANDRHQRDHILPEARVREFGQRHQSRSLHYRCWRDPGTGIIHIRIYIFFQIKCHIKKLFFINLTLVSLAVYDEK